MKSLIHRLRHRAKKHYKSKIIIDIIIFFIKGFLYKREKYYRPVKNYIESKNLIKNNYLLYEDYSFKAAFFTN